MKNPFFKYYQDIPESLWVELGFKHIAMYGMPLKNGGISDVSGKTLQNNGYEIPDTPSYEKWMRENSKLFSV